MKIMLTGASGFIGEFLVQELLRREHQLIALVRASAPSRWSNLENLEVMQSDLRQPQLLDLKGKGIDLVLHLAAVTKRSAVQPFQDTVTGTANLLAAARQAGIRRIVAVSSIAVLDYRSMRPMAVIDEHAPLAEGAASCDYTTSKLRQEQLLGDFAREGANACIVLRPGLVYDESRLEAAFAGICMGGISVLASHRGQVPTIEVRRLAAAIANAAERQLARWEVVHLVDDHLPSQSSYIAGLQRRSLVPRVRIHVPWRVLQGLCYFAGTLCAALGRGDKMPEVLLPQGFSRRLKPFRFSNTKAKRLLDWVPGQKFA
jgi:nucleoside-diphosphate-sugar epimerase